MHLLMLESRRILTDYGFQGHPLRKDFPLTVTIPPSSHSFSSDFHHRDTPKYAMTKNANVSSTNLFNSPRHSGMRIYSLSLSLHQSSLLSNFESLSPWEQVGEGTTTPRPDNLKHLPPPKQEETKKQ